MELDEFKTIIRQSTVNLWIGHISDGKEIEIRKQSGSIIEKIKKSLQLEMALAVFFFLLISWIIFRLPNLYLQIFALIMTVLCLCFTFYIAQLYKKIIYYQSTTTSIKTNLEQVINILKQFTRLYFILTLVMVPVILLSAISFGFASLQAITKTPLNTYSAQQLTALFGLSLAWCIATYFFTKWYIRKLYGNYLDSLKQQLRELEDE